MKAQIKHVLNIQNHGEQTEKGAIPMG